MKIRVYTPHVYGESTYKYKGYEPTFKSSCYKSFTDTYDPEEVQDIIVFCETPEEAELLLNKMLDKLPKSFTKYMGVGTYSDTLGEDGYIDHRVKEPAFYFGCNTRHTYNNNKMGKRTRLWKTLKEVINEK